MILLATTLLFGGCGSSNEDTNKDTNTENVQNDNKSNDSFVVDISMDTLKDADATSIEEFKYFFNEGGTYTISEYVGSSEMVVIPDEIDGIAVTNISSGVFSGNENIKAVKIGDNIVELGEKLFINAVNLKYVICGKNVKSIGDYCFTGTSLTDIELNDGLESIGYSTFTPKNGTLEKIYIPESVTYMDFPFLPPTVIHVKAGSYAETWLNDYLAEDPDGFEYVIE